jgi:[ribosomal protein S5]-alanine N-acetyltransferase
MPRLISPVVPAGSLSKSEQPTIGIDAAVDLRPWMAEDAAAVRSAFADPEIQRWHLVRMDSQTEADEWITATRAGWNSETVAIWAIAERHRNTVLGRISLYFKDLRNVVGEVTYWVLPQARGSRLAARGASALSDWAFDTGGLHRIELLHSTRNTASCRVANRAGFAVEGIVRSAQLHLDGRHDMHLHSRVASGLG